MTPQKSQAPLAPLLIAYLVFFNIAIMSSILNVAWTYMQTTFGVTLDTLGVLLLAAMSGGLLGTFFSGRVIGRLGLGRYLVSGSVITALGLLGYTIAPTWITLIMVAFVTSIGASTFNAGLNLFIAANYSTGRLNWLHAAYGVGLTLGPTLTTLIIIQLGQSWRLGYLIACLMTIGVTILLVITRERWVLSDEAAAPGKSAERVRADNVSLWETLRLPSVLLGMTVFFIFNGILAGVGQLSTTLLTARGIAQAGFWVSVYWGSFTVGRIIMGFVAHRLNNSWVIRASLFGAAVGGVLLWQNASTAINLIGLAVMGLSCAPLYPTLIAEAHRSVEVRYRANAIGFQISASGVGQALIPGGMAWLAEHVAVSLIGAVAAVGMIGVLALYQVALSRRQEALSVA